MEFWYQKSGEAAADELTVDVNNGLSRAEAEERLGKYGPNRLEAKKTINPFKLFINQFRDVLVIVLIISATVSLGLSFVPKERTLTGEEKYEHYVSQGRTAICNETEQIAGGKCTVDKENQFSNLPDSVIKEKESPKESLLIYGIVIAIALIGFLNEYKAERTVEALKKLVGQKAKVRRGGQVMEIEADTLVPGDVVLLEEGQKVPADIRLVSVKSLEINEASLTGESLPVAKTEQAVENQSPLGDQKCMAFAGTYIAEGTAEGVVVATGQLSELGKIADMVNKVEEEETPMQRKLNDLGKKLGLMIMIICAVVFVVVLFLVKEAREKDMLQRLIFAFTAAVALAVAAIPEGLAFVVRISLAIGARRMAAKNALVRKLSAVEALGSTDVICSDKTGTLTRGEMTVRELYIVGHQISVSGTGYKSIGEFTDEKGSAVTLNDTIKTLLRIGALCNNARLREETVLGDPTEGAMLVSAAKAGLSYEAEQKSWPRQDEVPFTSARKLMTTVNKNPSGGVVVASKGATEIILDKCDKYLDVSGKQVKLTPKVKQEILEVNGQLAKEALRVLAFAMKQEKSASATLSKNKLESGLVFVGLQAMMDPPREEVISVIHRVHAEAGMRVIMITGDYVETAKAVAKEIGIEGEAITGPELDSLSQAEFEDRVEHISVYARVNPEHKIRIVQALKKHGHQVAMTGDGVNDAPAIKAADIGIAMGINGTDAAKEASDLILLDDQFLTIVNAIEEGRGIFDNVRKFVNFLISCNIAEVLAILFGIIFFNNLLLTAAQLLFINIVTDGLPAIALGSDPARADALKEKPKYFQQAIITRRVWIEMFVFGALKTTILLSQFWYNTTHESHLAAVSAAFTSMVIFEMTRLVDVRTNYKIKWLSNPWLSVALASSIAIQFMVLYIPGLAGYFEVGPLSVHDWWIMAAGSIALITVMKLLRPVFQLFDKPLAA
jgi:P-type Ca2+ transporter type 2C